MARRRKNGNGIPRPLASDLRLAAAIADAVGPRLEVMTSKFDGIKGELDGIKSELEGHGQKLDQLIAGSVGVGRMLSLEARR